MIRIFVATVPAVAVSFGYVDFAADDGLYSGFFSGDIKVDDAV